MKRRRSRTPQRGAYKRKAHQYKVLCSVCEKEFLVPVAPPVGKNLTCLSCFQIARESEKEKESGSQAPLSGGQSAKSEMSG